MSPSGCLLHGVLKLEGSGANGRKRLTEAAYASDCADPTLFDNAFLS